jgi:hypothetical protein
MRNKILFWFAFFVLTLFEAVLLVQAKDVEQPTYTQVASQNNISERLRKL